METDFSKSFTNNQKIAVFNVLLGLLSHDDKVSRDKEITQLIKISEILDFNLDSAVLPYQVMYSSFQTSIETLNTLSKNQKEWVIISAISITGASGEIEQSKQESINNLSEHLGISSDEFENFKKAALQNMKRSKEFKENKERKNSGCFVILMFFLILLVSIIFIV